MGKKPLQSSQLIWGLHCGVGELVLEEVVLLIMLLKVVVVLLPSEVMALLTELRVLLLTELATVLLSTELITLLMLVLGVSVVEELAKDVEGKNEGTTDEAVGYGSGFSRYAVSRQAFPHT